MLRPLFTILLTSLLLMPLGCAKKKVYYPKSRLQKEQPKSVEAEPKQIVEENRATGAAKPKEAEPKEEIEDSIERFYNKWKGTPYRYGGMSHKGIDCSALTYYAYRDIFTIKLPRTVKDQIKQGRTVSKKELVPGDLVFFKTGLFQRHVGLYVGDYSFIHASTIKGVMISRLDDYYWKKKYWKARRLVDTQLY